MSEEDSEKDHSGREELEEMVRKMLSSGQIDPEALSKVAGLGANPAMMGQMFSQLRNLMSDSEGPINWKMAENQAMELAKKDESKNLGMYQNFAGGDETWFVMIHVAIEAEAGILLDNAAKLVTVAKNGDEAEAERLMV